MYWEPAFVNHVVQAWKDNGLPPNVPFFMTEGNDLDEGSPGTVKSGLWLADYVGSMLTAGAAGTFYFHYITTDRCKAAEAASCRWTTTATSRTIRRNISRRK